MNKKLNIHREGKAIKVNMVVKCDKTAFKMKNENTNMNLDEIVKEALKSSIQTGRVGELVVDPDYFAFGVESKYPKLLSQRVQFSNIFIS